MSLIELNFKRLKYDLVDVVGLYILPTVLYIKY